MRNVSGTKTITITGKSIIIINSRMLRRLELKGYTFKFIIKG